MQCQHHLTIGLYRFFTAACVDQRAHRLDLVIDVLHPTVTLGAGFQADYNTGRNAVIFLHQYTALDFALAEDEDGFVQAAVLFRDAGELSEGNIFVITQNSSTVITYGGPDDIYRYTDRCSLEIRGGDTVSYYVENYETGELVRFAFRCSELEDGTPHYETVDGPQ